MRPILIMAGAAGLVLVAMSARANSWPGAALLAQLFPASKSEVNLMSYDKNVQAFLEVIRHAEGTDGPNGYRMLFGGGLFDSWGDHPRIAVTRPAGSTTITSTAAGAYQILERTWDDVQSHLELPDFSPSSQDQAAIFLIDRRGALADVQEGNFAAAIAKCSREWASLPGSPYGQPTRPLAELEQVYANSGGVIA